MTTKDDHREFEACTRTMPPALPADEGAFEQAKAGTALLSSSPDDYPRCARG